MRQGYRVLKKPLSDLFNVSISTVLTAPIIEETQLYPKLMVKQVIEREIDQRHPIDNVEPNLNPLEKVTQGRSERGFEASQEVNSVKSLIPVVLIGIILWSL